MTAFDTDIGLTIPEKHKIVFTRRRHIVRVPTLKLSFIKTLKTAANTTVNDVIYAATAGTKDFTPTPTPPSIPPLFPRPTTLPHPFHSPTPPPPGAFHRLRAAHEDPNILHPHSGDKVKVRALLPVALPRQEGDPVRGMRNKCKWVRVRSR